MRACAGKNDLAHAARTEFCREYWYPTYAYIRRLGRTASDAEDLTQDFFAFILQRPWFDHADRARGKFRSFLLTSLNNFLHDDFDKRHSSKRGERYPHIPLDMRGAESVFEQSAAVPIHPAQHYEKEWIALLVGRALGRLALEYTEGGRGELYERLKGYLAVHPVAPSYESVAKETGLAAGTIQVGVHRMRQRYGELITEEVAKTVARPEEVEGEMRHMRAIFLDL